MKISRIEFVTNADSVLQRAPVFQLVAKVNDNSFKFPLGSMPFFSELSSDGSDLAQAESALPIMIADKYVVSFETITFRNQRRISPSGVVSTNFIQSGESKQDRFDKLPAKGTNEIPVFAPDKEKTDAFIRVYYEIKK